jgi:hypothetical protein
MDKRLFWRAALTQAVVVAVPFVILALLVDDKFFKDNGVWAGPLAWILASIVTALILKLPVSLAAFAAVAGGVCAAIITAAWAKHWIGLPVAVAVFGACCGGYETAQRELAAAERERKGEPPADDAAADERSPDATSAR